MKLHDIKKQNLTDDYIIKQDLANAYKILAYLNLDDHTYTHLSALSSDKQSFYIYPFGSRFEETDSKNLMRISLNEEVLEGNEYQYNKTGYVIHGAIYKARSDITAIFHTHTVSSVAVSAMKDGLLPISQWALHFYGQVTYHDYNSLVLEADQGNSLISDLSDKKIMFLRNHGTITCGSTIQETMFYTYHLEKACQTQIAALSTGAELIMPNADVCIKANKDLLSFEKNLGMRDWQAWVRLIEKREKV